MRTRASVDLPEPLRPMMPSASPGASETVMFWRTGGSPGRPATVTPRTSRRASGVGSGVGATGAGFSARSVSSAVRAVRARWRTGHWEMAVSMGASARPRRIEAAIMAPPVISPRRTSHAPAARSADWRKKRKARVKEPKIPPVSPEAVARSSAASCSAAQRAVRSGAMPCTPT